MTKRNFFSLFVILMFSVLVLSLTLTTATNASFSAVALTPRVFLPLQLRHYGPTAITETRLGISDRNGSTVIHSPQSLNLVTTAGFKWNRTSVLWAAVEPQNTTPDQYQWNHADFAILPFLNTGIEPLVLIFRSPSWAANSDCGPMYNNEDFAEFFGALVAHYPQVKYWTLFNEVDGNVYSIYHATSGGCFGEPDLDNNGNPDYADYAELMRVSWKAMHDANPNAQLIFGALAFDNFSHDASPPGYPGGCCFNYYFFENLMAYMQAHPLPEGDKYADVLGFNDYLAYNLAYWDHHSTGVGVNAKANYLRGIMNQYGFDFPMIITEMSAWPTLPSSEGVPQETQARQAVQMFAQAFYSNIIFTIWWTWDDYPDTDCQNPVPCDVFKYGLVTTNLTPKQSYFAVQNLASQLQGWEPDTARINDKYVDLGFKKDGKRKRVVYARTNTFDDAKTKVTFSVQRVRIIDMMGKVSTRDDNGTGNVTLTVTANPVYVEINPE